MSSRDESQQQGEIGVLVSCSHPARPPLTPGEMQSGPLSGLLPTWIPRMLLPPLWCQRWRRPHWYRRFSMLPLACDVHRIGGAPSVTLSLRAPLPLSQPPSATSPALSGNDPVLLVFHLHTVKRNNFPSFFLAWIPLAQTFSPIWSGPLSVSEDNQPPAALLQPTIQTRWASREVFRPAVQGCPRTIILSLRMVPSMRLR